MKTVLLAATFFCLLNFTNGQGGRLDPSFGKNGIVKIDLGKSYSYSSSGNFVLTQPDGSIYLIGETGNSNSIQGFITKRYEDGSIDSGYGVNGFSQNVTMAPSSAILQPDGKIVVAGSIDRDINGYDVAIARFNPDGSLDSSFSEDGIQGNFNFRYTVPKPVVIQSNEKIVVFAGFAIARYNANGDPDSTFNTTGLLYDNFGYKSGGFAIVGGAIQKDSKIVTAGAKYVNYGDTSVYLVKRYNTDGSADITFGDSGMQRTYFNSVNVIPNSVAINDDGKILVGGGTLVRYNSDGSLDTSFSDDGIVPTDFYVDFYTDQGYSITLQNDKKIVITGNTGIEGVPNFTISRYNTDGSIDNTFSGDGMITNEFKTTSAAIQQDGKIIVSGSANANFALARYTANGTSDNAFGKNGNVTDSIRSGYTVYQGSAIQQDGKIVAAGRTWNGRNFDFAVARYNTDGSLDNTFSIDGAEITDFVSADNSAKSVAIQTNGKIVVAGSSGKYFSDNYPDTANISIARYNNDGSPDNTFGSNGKIQTIFMDKGQITISQISSVAIQKDGKIVAAGSAIIKDEEGFYNRNFALIRYNTDGSLDNTFDEDGMKSISFLSDDNFDEGGAATSLAIQKDGKIVVAGVYGTSDKFTPVARLNTNGSLDSTFGEDGKGSTGGHTGDFVTTSVALQNDGKIVSGGYSFYRGDNQNNVGRLNTDGSFDNSFSVYGYNFTQLENNTYPANDFGTSVAIQDDGKIVVLGAAFTRYKTDGSLDSSFGTNGIQETPDGLINSIAISGNKLYGIGSGKAPGNVGLIARYLLDNNSNNPPTVSLTAPSDNATYIAPVNLQLAATAADADGTITKVEFYSGDNLLYTDSISPYNFIWKSTPAGNYTLTAKATDNSGLTTVSAPVHVAVVSNKAPIVSITNPVNNRTFAAPAYIHFEVEASDIDGRVTRVEFYSGSTLLATEYKAPYKFVWKNLPVGIYTVIAVATDNFGAQTMSAPVTVKVKEFNTTIVSSKPIAETNDFDTKTAISLKAWPNPVNKTLTISTTGLQQNRLTTISILSTTGVVLKTIRINNSTTQLDVSSLTSGVYTIKLLCEDKVLYKQFVKL